MKTLVLIGMLLAAAGLHAQTHTEKITKEFTFEKKSADNALMIANINGSIKVEGYTGDKILVEVTKTIYAKTQARLEKGKEKIQLGVIDRADSIILYAEGECNKFGRKTNRGGKNQRGWGYSWENNDRSCNEEYDYRLDFFVKVPASINIDVSTINNGDVSVQQVSGVVIANNINGSIKLQNLVREAVASTINGDVDIDYSTNPKKDCRFYSLNGDINAQFRKGLGANLSFESFNGNFFTNIDKLETMPVQIEKSNNGEGIRYKINGNRYQAGAGGALLDFETFNGNVYLKEKVN
ncbi:MAG TPA: hypothetical protein VIM75_11900 [Ohtaekwangia sp.]|uniref:hypothetical protein n=1 Tax=Ohtaekwangia sp. TaxID=2066019 RepID=UPI002F94C092